MTSTGQICQALGVGSSSGTTSVIQDLSLSWIFLPGGTSGEPAQFLWGSNSDEADYGPNLANSADKIVGILPDNEVSCYNLMGNRWHGLTPRWRYWIKTAK